MFGKFKKFVCRFEQFLFQNKKLAHLMRFLLSTKKNCIYMVKFNWVLERAQENTERFFYMLLKSLKHSR